MIYYIFINIHYFIIENGMKEIIAMKMKRLELEERKVKALERIASALEGHQGQS